MNKINLMVVERQLILFEAQQPKRFRPKVIRKSINNQRRVFQGQTAANIAKQRNAALAKRKAYYRKMYLDMKKREQKMYGNVARAQSYRR